MNKFTLSLHSKEARGVLNQFHCFAFETKVMPQCVLCGALTPLSMATETV